MHDCFSYVDLIGCAFEYDGRGPEFYDCYGLLMEMHRRFYNRELPDYKAPQRIDEIGTAMDRIASKLWRPRDPGVGATILFSILGVGRHVGFQVDKYRFIHSWEGQLNGVMVEEIQDWEHRIIRFKNTTGYYEYVG